MNWTREAGSLLLYLETCAVDNAGRVDGRRMNSDDHGIAATMQSEGLLRFGRLLSRCIEELSKSYRCTHWVELTDVGWSEAARLRRERGVRNVCPVEDRTESRRMERGE